MQWYKLEIDITKTDIQTQFKNLIAYSGPPWDMVVFLDNSHIKKQTLYFSPACSVRIRPFLDKYGCQPCDAPDRKSVGLWVGDECSVDIIFSSEVG